MTPTFGFCHVPSDGNPPDKSWQAAARVFGAYSLLRTGGRLSDLFPTPTTTDFTALRAVVASAKAARMRVLINATEPPAWATGGVPAYVGGIRGSAWGYVNTFAATPAD